MTDLLPDIPDPRDLEDRLVRLGALAEARHRDWLAARDEALASAGFLALAPRAEALLDELARALFGQVLDEIEASLTQAIREILGQERTVRSERDINRGKLTISLEIDNQGRPEDIMSGQGGSVCNILSVSLRLIALARLDPARHRPFLVLDEQDCWLKPELVPRFMKLIAQIAERLGMQALVISHHPLDLFSGHARRIYSLSPSTASGVRVELMKGEDGDGKEDGEAG